MPFVRSLVSVSSTALPQRPSLSVPGHDLFKRFANGDEIKNENYVAVLWFRAPEMDAFAAELLNLHGGSLELDALGDSVQVGQKSSNGIVEHVGEGVYVEENTIAIDPNSKISLPTITRLDQRETARLALDTVDNPNNPPKVTVVGQAGIGKTRGGLTYTLQQLLWRGEAVIRVGYKDEKAFLFLPDEDGVYKVWRTKASAWSDSELAADARTYALIDPPEAKDVVYKDSASCHVIKWASNNAAKHYHNWEKDGMLLLTAIPSEAEVLAMIPFLWTELTPFPDQRVATAEAKVEEIRKRCALVGCVLRIVFNHEFFQSHLLKVVAESKTLGMKMDPALLKCYYDGTMTTADGEASSVSSKMYLIGPMPGDASHKKMFAKLNPLAALVTRTQLEEAISGFNVKSAFVFEDFTRIMLKGGMVGGVNLRSRDQVNKDSHAETSAFVCTLTDDQNKFVVAPTNYPVFDMATSLYDWYNAKVGNSKPKIGSGPFVKVMTQLGLARVVGDELHWEKDKEAKITLTFMRNRSFEDWEFTDSFRVPKKDAKVKKVAMDFEKVKAFFQEHVEVKTLDISNWTPLSSPECDAMSKTSDLVHEYEDITGQKLT